MPPATATPIHSPFLRRGYGLWRPANKAQALPGPLRGWLLDPGSLTAKLRQLSGGHLSVQILRQAWGRPQLSEARELGVPTSRRCLIREVVLRGPADEAWVFARSLFPASSLTGELRHLRQLDNRPLGGYLFSHPDLGRSPMAIAELASPSVVPAKLQKGQTLWGRRSVFTLKGKPLLVSEIFLPTFAPNDQGH